MTVIKQNLNIPSNFKNIILTLYLSMVSLIQFYIYTYIFQKREMRLTFVSVKNRHT